MNEILAVIFVLALFILSTAGREFERIDEGWLERTELRNEGLDFETGMEKIDSLWNVIMKWK